MVLVALAGGSGGVGREVLECILEQGQHQVIVLSRQKATVPGCKVIQVDYDDLSQLTTTLTGVHTVLSFILDYTGTVQKKLIDACLAARVKRFAPSEWAWMAGPKSMLGYKSVVYDHLKQINTHEKRIEFCAFRPGFFMNYLSWPQPSTKHLHLTCALIDVQSCRALMIRDEDPWIVMTAIEDVAMIAALALSYEPPWPSDGGMVGQRIRMRSLIKLLEKFRGKSFTLYEVDRADLVRGEIRSEWIPTTDHPSIAEKDRLAMSRKLAIEVLLALVEDEMDVKPVWNELLPEHSFTDVTSFLHKYIPK